MADIDIGQISEALNNKTDRNMRNVDTGTKADSVIDYQEPTAENGYTWYRKYASGWVEQGGVFTASTGGGAVSITYPVEMSNTNYCALLGETDNNTNNQYIQLRFYSKTTTGASIYTNLAGSHTNSWQVSGMSV